MIMNNWKMTKLHTFLFFDRQNNDCIINDRKHGEVNMIYTKEAKRQKKKKLQKHIKKQLHPT